MKRQRQTLEEIVGGLSAIRVSWRDAHADAVLSLLDAMQLPERYDESLIRLLLDANFDAGLTVIRLALDLSKDEMTLALKGELGKGPGGAYRYRQEPEALAAALLRLGAPKAIEDLITTPVSWRSILAERLKSGRGSAIKGQARGRFLEDATQRILDRVFGEHAYDIRCRFLGVAKTSTEKADFAVPSKEDPRILIEVKAYGATGSKQTDILGDIGRIVEQKRHDTHLLLVTDGLTWNERRSDLAKLVELQNSGKIARIYTLSMAEDLEDDLRQLKDEHGL